jgi:crossover junction endodeoxyribonuclease RuvC
MLQAITGPILSLDLATRIGFCVGAPGAMPVFGEHQLPSTAENIGAFACAYEDWLAARLAADKPELVIFEAPILPQKTQLMTVRKLTGLAFETERLCTRAHIRCLEGRKSTVNKAFTGSGRASKDDTMAMARQYGFKVRGEDEADAVALWCFACLCYAPTAASNFNFGPLAAARFAGGPLSAKPLGEGA